MGSWTRRSAHVDRCGGAVSFIDVSGVFRRVSGNRDATRAGLWVCRVAFCRVAASLLGRNAAQNVQMKGKKINCRKAKEQLIITM